METQLRFLSTRKVAFNFCTLFFLFIFFQSSNAQVQYERVDVDNIFSAGRTDVLPRMVGQIKAQDVDRIQKSQSRTNDCGNIAFNAEDVRRCDPTGEFIVDYNGFTPDAQDAFQYAVDIWSRLLNLEVPIQVTANFAPLAPGVLGQAGPDGFFNIGGIVYPSALSDQLVGFDIIGSDMTLTFSSEFPFYFGLDGCPPAGQFDFVTIVLHELGHGLGFLSSDFVFAANQFPDFFGPGHPAGACVGFAGGTLPYIYDLFLNSASFGGTPYDALSAPGITPAGFGCFFGLEAYYTNNDLTLVSPGVTACVGGPAAVYSPANYQDGSSISHFDESTFSGVDPNALLTPFVAPGQAVHDPGCALSLLGDLGFDINDTVDGVGTVSECKMVPTMSQWGLMIFGLLILNMGIVFLYRTEEIIAI